MRYLTFVYWIILVLVVESIRNENLHQDKENLILEEEKRGAEKLDNQHVEKQDLQKSQTNRGLFVTSGIHGHRPQTSGSGYEISSYGNSGPEYHYGPSGDGDGGGGGSGIYRPSNYPGSGYGVGYHHSAGGPEVYGHSGPGSSPSTQQHGNNPYNALALKKFLLPLAGLVLLGAATALSTSPILLQLGVVSGKKRKRRRRDTRNTGIRSTKIRDGRDELINTIYERVSSHLR